MKHTSKKTHLTKKYLLWIFLVLFVVIIFAVVTHTNNEVTSKIRTPKQSVAIPCQGEVTNSIKDPSNTLSDVPPRTELNTNQLGETLIISGVVTDTDCKTVANALVMVWQADASGDAQALQGKTYTDASGNYTFTTVMPVVYQKRAPHINFAVQATEQSPLLVTQVFFPDNVRNKTDVYYDDSLLFSIHPNESHTTARYNFIVER